MPRPQLLTHDGLTLTIRQWAERIGLSYEGLRARLARHTVAEALTTPIGEYKGHKRKFVSVRSLGLRY